MYTHVCVTYIRPGFLMGDVAVSDKWVSETATFLKREMTKKSYGFIRGSPLAGNNNETFCIYTGAFWVVSVRLSLGSRKVD